eukprot:CAMPEP_0172602050 /NCGR_PEP_ID=MMETSP1068-20121228/22247_1 /TAXON_ID=35684 /ORGANISM="Pseudopedinella elastica, Strain CCMP716" /LENGTH=341 /DNA_ID=CAMNT_0013403285 /DNA_START=344 /DNA_END=1371 /DNA_ORIENTATION=+
MIFLRAGSSEDGSRLSLFMQNVIASAVEQCDFVNEYKPGPARVWVPFVLLARRRPGFTGDRRYAGPRFGVSSCELDLRAGPRFALPKGGGSAPAAPTNNMSALEFTVSSSAFGAGAQCSPSGPTTARGLGSASELVHAGGSGQVSDPNELGFGVAHWLAHAEPGESSAPGYFSEGLSVAGSFASLVKRVSPHEPAVCVVYLEQQTPGTPAPAASPAQSTASDLSEIGRPCPSWMHPARTSARSAATSKGIVRAGGFVDEGKLDNTPLGDSSTSTLVHAEAGFRDPVKVPRITACALTRAQALQEFDFDFRFRFSKNSKHQRTIMSHRARGSTNPLTWTAES